MLHKLYPALRKAVSLLCIAVAIVCPASTFGQYILTVAGSGAIANTPTSTGDGGPALAAKMDTITSVAFTSGNLYINDQWLKVVRKVSPDGIISVMAGKSGTAGYSGNGGPATSALLRGNFSIATDNAENVYIADMENNVVRKVNSAGIISTIAGNGTAGFSGDGGPATSAQLEQPMGVAVDNAGNVFIGDSYNKRIRKVSSSGIITTIAGIGEDGYTGDGGAATFAKIGAYTYQLATDDAGNLYFSDGTHHCVRKVTPAGIITTVAGTGTGGYSGDGGLATSAQLRYPTGVYVSHDGEVYIADCKNNRVRKVNTAGIISTIAGTGTAAFGGDNGPAVAAQLNFPIALCADADGNLIIADSRNYRIRKIVKPLTFVNGHIQDIEVCENGTIAINDAMTVRDFTTGFTDNWTLVSAPAHGYASVSYTATSAGGTITPSGLTYSPLPGYTGVDSFKVRVANSVESDVTTVHVKVNALLTTAGSITGPGNVCTGSTITLSASIPGGTWSSSSANVSISPMGPECKVDGVSAGTSDVLYTLTNICGSLSTSNTVTVNPLPITGSLTGPDAVCVGSSISISATVSGGIWNSSTGKATVTAGIVTGVAEGNEIIRYTVSNAWCQATVTHIITVETFPDAKKIWGVDQMCIGETSTLTDSATNGVWASGSPLASLVPITPPTPARCVVTALAVGTAAISYSITNSCGTAHATHDIAVYPLPNSPEITEHLGLLSVPLAYDSYQWTKNGVIIPGAVKDTFFALDPSIYAVTVTNSHGCKSSSSPLSYAGCKPDDILLYPNPSNATVRVLWCQRVNVRVMSIDGRVISIQKGVSEVSLEGLPNAVYMLDIFNNNNKAIKTIRITKFSGQ